MTTRDNSIAAFEHMVKTGQISKQRAAVLRAFVEHGPGTSAEVLHAAGMADNLNLRRARVTELSESGHLVIAETRACKVTGRQAAVWRFCSEPKPRPPEPSIDWYGEVKRILSAVSKLDDERVEEAVASAGWCLWCYRKLSASKECGCM